MQIFMYLFLLILVPDFIYDAKVTKHDMLYQINEIRSQGCKCGRKKMPAVSRLSWSTALEDSAMRHARDMKKHDYFSHFSRNGKSVGDRLDALGYNWQHIGENIATGQINFTQVLEDWMDSQTHCEMIMNKDMREMGISRVGNYWVQHFGTEMKK